MENLAQTQKKNLDDRIDDYLNQFKDVVVETSFKNYDSNSIDVSLDRFNDLENEISSMNPFYKNIVDSV